jgi:glutamyl-tRNA synthetase
MDDKAVKKFLVAAAAPRLRALHHVLEESQVWDAPSLEARISAWLREQQLELKDIGQPVRVALTGRTASPSLFEVLDLLGRDVALARLSRAAELAASSP